MEVGGKWEVTANGYRVSLGGGKNVLKLTVAVMVAQVRGYTESHRIVHSKWMNCTVCELHLNIAVKKCQGGRLPRWHSG